MELSTVVVVWLAFAILTSIVAASKGRSGFGWLLLSLAFGFFALLAVALMPGSQKEAATPQGERDCPFCAERIKVAAVKCRHCGSEIEKPKSEPLPAFFTRPEGVGINDHIDTFCKHFGAARVGDRFFCRGNAFGSFVEFENWVREQQ